jgi:RNA polymerase sigma-70 factor (ECF subfamily)
MGGQSCYCPAFGMSSSSDRAGPVTAIGEQVVPPEDAKTDVDLMARVAARDPDSERALLERVGGRVRRITRLLCGSPADSDDAAQSALIEILRSAGTFRVGTSLERWADTIAVRTTLRAARRERERKHLLARWLLPGMQPWGDGFVSPSEAVGLDGFLDRLAPDRRRALVLHHALDYTVDEIAELTGAPPGTVKDRLVSARKQLRLLLERDARRRGGS